MSEQLELKPTCESIRKNGQTIIDMLDLDGDPKNEQVLEIVRKFIKGAHDRVAYLLIRQDISRENLHYNEANGHIDKMVSQALEEEGEDAEGLRRSAIADLVNEIRGHVNGAEQQVFQALIQAYESPLLDSIGEGRTRLYETSIKFMEAAKALFRILLLEKRIFDEAEASFRSYENRKDSILGQAERLDAKLYSELKNILQAIDAHIVKLRDQLVLEKGGQETIHGQETTEPQPTLASSNPDTGENSPINDTGPSASLAGMTYPALKDTDIRERHAGRSKFNQRALARWKAAQASPDKK